MLREERQEKMSRNKFIKKSPARIQALIFLGKNAFKLYRRSQRPRALLKYCTLIGMDLKVSVVRAGADDKTPICRLIIARDLISIH